MGEDEPALDFRGWAVHHLGLDGEAGGVQPGRDPVCWAAVHIDVQAPTLPRASSWSTSCSICLSETWDVSVVAFVADSARLPLLERFDATDRGVAEALRKCEPVRRARGDELAGGLFDTLHARLPAAEIALYGERFVLGLSLEVGPERAASGRRAGPSKPTRPCRW